MGVYTKDGQTYFGEPKDEGKRLVCANCGQPICVGQIVAYEPGPNKITHVEPKCVDTKPLKREGPDERSNPRNT